MEGVEVPSLFLCPISLQIMRDPVTLHTGITYDREHIERWIFAGERHTCPLTNRPLTPADCDLIVPNHTLRRMIQAWCTPNASHGVERFPTTRPPVTKAHILDLVDDATTKPHCSTLVTNILRKLKAIVSESERNMRVVESSGAVGFLASIIETSLDEGQGDVLDEALKVLYSIQVSEHGLTELAERRGGFIGTLTAVLQISSYQCRAHSAVLLNSLVSVTSPARLMGLNDEFFVEVVKVLRDKISHQSTKAALQILSEICPWGSNKIIKAVEAGAVPVLIELLLDESDKKATEVTLGVLARLSGCAQGRAEIVGHAAGIAVVAQKLFMVSAAASEMAAMIMHSITRFLPTAAVLREMLEVGAVSKMCLLTQVDGGSKNRERVKKMLSLHARVWRSSPCSSPKLQSFYISNLTERYS